MSKSWELQIQEELGPEYKVKNSYGTEYYDCRRMLYIHKKPKCNWNPFWKIIARIICEKRDGKYPTYVWNEETHDFIIKKLGEKFDLEVIQCLP
jgi:hypothetical protein